MPKRLEEAQALNRFLGGRVSIGAYGWLDDMGVTVNPTDDELKKEVYKCAYPDTCPHPLHRMSVEEYEAMLKQKAAGK